MAYELWVWLVQEADGTEVACEHFRPGSRDAAERVRPVAELLGRPVRLAHLVEQPPDG